MKFRFKIILFFLIGLFFTGCSKEAINLEFSSLNLEYGEKVNFNKLLETDGFKITKNTYDSMTLGEQKITFTLVDEDKNESKVTYSFTVEDTQKPEIELKEDFLTVDFDSEFDPKDNVKSCTDPVDGDVEFTTEGKVKTSKAGEYVVVVKAVDKNGNESSVEYKVVVKEKEEKQQASKSNGNSTSSSNSGSQQGSGSSNQSTPATGSSNSSSLNNSGSSSNSSGSSTPTYVAPAEGYKYDYAMNVFNLVNQERMIRGLSALSWNQQLYDEISMNRAYEISMNFSHDGLQKYVEFGYVWGNVSVTEVIVWESSGVGTPEYAVELLLNSAGHYNTIMDVYAPNLSMAVSTYYANKKWYACINFTYDASSN